jgi:hypothetical protein
MTFPDHPSKTGWEQLEAVLPANQRDLFARIMIKALHSEFWHKIDLEFRDHKLHAIDITQRINVDR